MAIGAKRVRGEQENTPAKNVVNDVNVAIFSLTEANEAKANEDVRRKKSFQAELNRRSEEGVAQSAKESGLAINLSPACAALSNQLRFISPSDLAELTSNQANMDNFEKNAERGQRELEAKAVQDTEKKLSPAERDQAVAKKKDEVQKGEEVTAQRDSLIFIDLLSKTGGGSVRGR